MHDAGTAAWNLRLLATRPKPEGFYDPNDLAAGDFDNSDIAFRGNLLFLGNYTGFQIWDISRPENPVLRTTIICPGNQGIRRSTATCCSSPFSRPRDGSTAARRACATR